MAGIEGYFQEQLEEFEAFFLDPEHTVLRLVIDPEMQRLPLNYLARREEDRGFPHLIIALTDPFDSPYTWYGRALEILNEEIDRHAEALAQAAPGLAATPAARQDPERPWTSFLARAEALAENLPDSVGSLVFVIVVDDVTDQPMFARGLRFLADEVSSIWLKFVVIEPRLSPRAEEIAEHPKVANQLIWLSPDEIERRSESALANSASDPAARRRSLAAVGLMAFGKKDYAKAESAQQLALREAEESKEPLDIALALYNLGNTYIAAGEADQAVADLDRAAELCTDHDLDELAPMVFTNLGVALHHAGESDQAFQSLKVARDLFCAQSNLPGEAHVCDTLALLYHEQERRPEAEKAWRYALSLYQRITNPAMADVREGGRKDIAAKLEHFGYGHAG